MDVARAVQEVKAGKVEFRTDKTAWCMFRWARFRSRRKSWSRTQRSDHQRRESKACGCERQVHQGLLSELHMGPGIALDTTPIEDGGEGVNMGADVSVAKAGKNSSGRVRRLTYGKI
jgi:hypothetical protein